MPGEDPDADVRESESADPASTRTGGRRLLTLLVPGGVFLLSGASLVVYVLTGAPMALVLALLVVLGVGAVALTLRGEPERRRAWSVRVRVGVPVGLAATVLYDLSRWALVSLAGLHVSPFTAFPLFGQALVGEGVTGAVWGWGVAFHLLNGVAFGIAYTVWFGHRPVWAGIAFALGLEAFMLAIYPGWLDIRALQEFTQMSVLGHVVYGTALGFGARWLLRRSTARGAERSGSTSREAVR
ncbi:hypothetical protein [Cellulomonas cellasea]|uniref:Uncharacterized protein n=2 Tax=Cellulomonas cellasea TaxID=43670 RepID=A0A0A0B5X9_9CELL|nr:hypothetical protein [Cellulomonas cellasea]KGM00686.1 hypothetical protein Q760_06795 [Cellulomonas cellasea DSM 20118]GEA87796.1 hypothetical protein CCE01nite_17450 [Cellulomonas cellasea]